VVFRFSESKNQESPEQEANGGAKSDLTAIQNHNLLIALAHGGTSGAAQFAMPVSCYRDQKRQQPNRLSLFLSLASLSAVPARISIPCPKRRQRQRRRCRRFWR
jgi:hypothetical protein